MELHWILVEIFKFFICFAYHLRKNIIDLERLGVEVVLAIQRPTWIIESSINSSKENEIVARQ